MSGSDDHFDGAFEDHTLLKHAYLQTYLPAWAFKLLHPQGNTGRVLYVDGFAGPGCDGDGNPGSPTIACKVAQKVKTKRGEDGCPGARLSVIAIEKKESYYNHLNSYLDPFRREEPQHVETHHGLSAAHLPDIIRRAGQYPTLYFLDPFGVQGLDASLYPSMLAGPRNEIFALFDKAGAARLRGVVHAQDSDLRGRLTELRSSHSLFPELDEIETAQLAAEREQREAKRAPTQPSAIEAITAAIGGDGWVTECADLNPEAFRREILKLFVARLVLSGATYVQVIPMCDAAGVPNYSLVHASKSVAAVTTMKEAVSAGLNRDDLSAVMRERIRIDLAYPVARAIGDLSRQFAGREVRWSGEDASTARGYLLTSTPVFNFQCDAIKKELKAQGILRKNAAKQEVCEFPAGTPTP